MKNLRVILGLALNIWICPLPEFVFTFNTVTAKAQQKAKGSSGRKATMRRPGAKNNEIFYHHFSRFALNTVTAKAHDECQRFEGHKATARSKDV